MNILSFCKDYDYKKSIDYEVVQASESDIPSMNITHHNFQAILVDDCEVIKSLSGSLTKKARLMIPVIMLLKQNASYAMIRNCIDSGATDFSLEPYLDLKNIIVQNFRKIDELLDSAEAKLNQLRVSLMHSIPHEFNTPLTSIIGLAGIMAKDPVCEPKMLKEFSMNILIAAERLQRVIDNFTYYSHLQIKLSSNSEVAFARSFSLSNPDQIIKLVIHELQYVYEREISFTVDPGMVQFNETNFYKLVYHLLENALKFSTVNSVVMVGSYMMENEYRIVIYNEGSGFDQEQLEFLGAFSQFNREVNEQQGVGMGIAIALSLLKLYDGRLKILTENDKYTKVEIFLKG